MEGDSNLACLTYENVLMKEDQWMDKDVVWLMGKRFILPDERQEFLDYVRSRLWLTYRRGFDAIGGTGPTCDSGWGCMLRCGQMMLAQALLKLKLSSDWKWRPDERQNEGYYKILRNFADQRSSCYSIHQIAQMGVQEGKNVGEWFGPNTVAQVLKKLSAFDECKDITIYVAMDNTICKKDIESLFFSESASKWPETSAVSHHSSSATGVNTWKPLLLFIPLRLGLSEINPLYFENLKHSVMWKESVGMIGGKPNHAYYFIGCTDTDFMVFLDPHTTQPNVNWIEGELNSSADSSYHCDSPSKMAISQLDPSLALGFLCKDRDEFDSLCARIKSQGGTKESLALFDVVESLPPCNVIASVSVSVHNRRKNIAGNSIVDENACLTLDSDEDLDDIDEDFEILEVS